MATNFPNSPSNGDTHVFGGTTYTYNSTKGVWNSSASSGGGGASVTTDDTAPSSPSDGDLWWDSAGGKMYVYYEDTDSSQWVSVSVPGSTGPAGADASPTSYTNFAGFPSSGNKLGDFAIAQDTKALYVWDGTEWDRIAAGSDESPVILTEPPTTIQLLNSDGTTSTVTMTAQDPEGFDITYGIAYKTANNARPAQLSADTTINQTTGTYTFTPSTTASDAGTFKARLSASDGVTTTTRFVNFNLTFQVDITFSASEPGVTTDLTNSIVFSASGSNGGSGMAQSANLQTGKYYFEMSLTSVNTEIMIGFAPESITDPGWNASSDLAAVYSANGNWYPGGSVNAVSGGYTNGDVLMLAYDTANRQVWVGKNGSWVTNPSSTGKSIGGTGEMTLIAGSAAGAGASLSANILVGSSNLNYSVPTGFSAY